MALGTTGSFTTSGHTLKVATGLLQTPRSYLTRQAICTAPQTKVAATLDASTVAEPSSNCPLLGEDFGMKKSSMRSKLMALTESFRLAELHWTATAHCTVRLKMGALLEAAFFFN